MPPSAISSRRAALAFGLRMTASMWSSGVRLEALIAFDPLLGLPARRAVLPARRCCGLPHGLIEMETSRRCARGLADLRDAVGRATAGARRWATALGATLATDQVRAKVLHKTIVRNMPPERQ